MLKIDEWNLIIYAPAYNVEKPIKELLRKISIVKNKLDKKGIKIKKFIVVNDGSNDNTLKILKRFQKNNEFLKIVNNKKNKGPVSAVFEGMQNVLKISKKLPNEKTIVVHMDSDMEHNPLDIEKMIEPIVKNKKNISVGIMNFKNYSFHSQWFNSIVGKYESKKFLKLDIPQFCPGFSAIKLGTFKKFYPKIKEMAKRFKQIYKKDMLTMDFVILTFEKQTNKNMSLVKLSKVEKRWIKNQPIEKLIKYFDYHMKTVEFLEKN